MLVIPSASEGPRLRSWITQTNLCDPIRGREVPRRLCGLGMTRDWSVKVTQNFRRARSLAIKAKILRLPRHHRLRLRCRLRHHFVSLGDADHFFDRGNALSDPSPAIVPQRFHALRNSALLQLASVSLLQNQSPQRLGHEADLVDGNAPLIASLPAMIAARAAIEFEIGRERHPQFLEILHRITRQSFAFGTNRAHEALRNERLDHAREQKRLNIHIE